MVALQAAEQSPAILRGCQLGVLDHGRLSLRTTKCSVMPKASASHWIAWFASDMSLKVGRGDGLVGHVACSVREIAGYRALCVLRDVKLSRRQRRVKY